MTDVDPTDLDTFLLPDAPAAMVAGETAPLLSVRNLSVEFPTDDGIVHAVDDVSFDVVPNETLGIVGESGSGKSVTSLAILGLLPKEARVSGEVRFRGENILGISENKLRELRGDRIAMIFQDALAALNPVFTVGHQIAEAIAVHHDLPKRELEARVVELLDLVGISQPGAARQAVSARVLGRHAPAGDDRDVDRERSRRVDRRRADDRARRHHPGAGARGARADPGPHQLRDHVDHARPRRGRGRRRLGSSSCTRAGTRRWGRSTRSSTSRSIRTRGLLASLPRRPPGRERAAAPDRRTTAVV